MRGHEEDIQLAKMLKEEAYQTTQNQWFTRRVLNRLPPRRRRNWFIAAVYAIVALVCAMSWKMMLTGLEGTVTVRDMIYMAIMAAVTLYAIASCVATATHSD